MCLCECVYGSVGEHMHVLMCVQACGGQWSVSSSILSICFVVIGFFVYLVGFAFLFFWWFFFFFFLKHCLSLNLELTHSLGLLVSKFKGSCCLCHLRTGLQNCLSHGAFNVGDRDLDSGPHNCTASTVPTDHL